MSVDRWGMESRSEHRLALPKSIRIVSEELGLEPKPLEGIHPVKGDPLPPFNTCWLCPPKHIAAQLEAELNHQPGPVFLSQGQQYQGQCEAYP